MPLSLSVAPSFSSRPHRASRSLGVVNMHLMSWLADRMVTAWSMTCSWYALRCSIQPFLMSLTTQRGSRSRQKQPPRAGRAEHQPVGSLGEVLVGQRGREHLIVDPVVLADDAALGDAGGAAG